MLKTNRPSLPRKTLAALVANLLATGLAVAGEPVFELGAIQVIARKTALGEEQVSSIVTREGMRTFSSPGTRLTVGPQNKLTTYAVTRPFGQLQTVPYVESESSRWTSNTVKTSDHATLNLKAMYTPLPNLDVEAGVTDENYTLAYGFPNPGRMWFANANYRFWG